MPKYTVTDPTTKRTVVLTGDSPPTEAELENIFKTINTDSGGSSPMNFAIVNGQRVPIENALGPVSVPDDIKAELQRIGTSESASPLVENLKFLRDAGGGAAKGLGSSAVGLGQLAHMIPGVSTAVDALYDQAGAPAPNPNARAATVMGAAPQTSLGLNANNGAERLGKLLEQMAEYAVPGGLAERSGAQLTQLLRPLVSGGRLAQFGVRVLPQMATQGAANAGVAAMQGANPAVAGAIGAAGPVAQEGGTVMGQWLKDRGEGLVRAAVKPSVASLKKLAGASQTGIDAQAQRLTRFIIDNRLTSPERAQAIIDETEHALQGVITGAGNPLTDAPSRTIRYLSALKASAAKQGLPAHDVDIIAQAAKEVIQRSNMGEDVTRMVLKPSGILDASGKPIMTPQATTTRQLRSGVPAREALEGSRATSRWTTRKAYGELKGAQVESAKATDRAGRDAVKYAIPAAKPILGRQSQAITAREALDRMVQRAANRDAVSLPAHVMAAGEIASGRPPVLAIAANWLRNNQLKAGIYADQLAQAIERRDVRKVIRIMGRLGAGRVIQATRPQTAQASGAGG